MIATAASALSVSRGEDRSPRRDVQRSSAPAATQRHVTAAKAPPKPAACCVARSSKAGAHAGPPKLPRIPAGVESPKQAGVVAAGAATGGAATAASAPCTPHGSESRSAAPTRKTSGIARGGAQWRGAIMAHELCRGPRPNDSLRRRLVQGTAPYHHRRKLYAAPPR